jgi:hypothetical protein
MQMARLVVGRCGWPWKRWRWRVVVMVGDVVMEG